MKQVNKEIARQSFVVVKYKAQRFLKSSKKCNCFIQQFFIIIYRMPAINIWRSKFPSKAFEFSFLLAAIWRPQHPS